MKSILSQIIDDFQEREIPELVKRTKEFPEIEGKADVVIGMRRSGKTYFCFQKIRSLLSEGIPKSHILHINFEDDRLLSFTVSDFQLILEVYHAKFPGTHNNRTYFFFDEIQRIENWEIFIRRLIDTEKNRVYITGSSSKLLSTEIATGLRGRSLTTEIFPFNFIEFLKYHKIFNSPPTSFSSNTSSLLRKAFSDYFDKGGFPEIQNIDRNYKIEILQGYINSVLLKDIIERYSVSNILVLKHLVRIIIASTGQQFSVNKFFNTMKSMSIKCTKNTLYKYLDYLVDAYLFYPVPIHTRSEKVRMVNPPKIYTIDTGLINAMSFRNSRNRGYLLENMVFMYLRQKRYTIEFVRTKDNFETDFYAKHPVTGNILLVQVCFDLTEEKTFNREIRGLRSAMTELSIEKGTIITWDDEKTIDKNIKVIPAWKWMLRDP